MPEDKSPGAARARWLPAALIAACTLAAAPAAWGVTEGQKLATARQVYLELMRTPDRAAPEHLIEEARCIAVIPSVIKGAFWWGGRHGRGVLSCRNDRGAWSPPAFVQLSGGSVGFQIGGASTDHVLFFMTRRSIESVLESKLVLGADASVAAGPVGRSAEASTDGKLNAEIYAYARSRGLFAGVSIEGARLAVHQKAIQQYYGRRIWPEDILFKHRVPELPREARKLLRALP